MEAIDRWPPDAQKQYRVLELRLETEAQRTDDILQELIAVQRQRDDLLAVALKLQKLYRGLRSAATYEAIIDLRDDCEKVITNARGAT